MPQSQQQINNKLLPAIIQTTFNKMVAYRRLRLLREYLQQQFFLSEKNESIEDFLAKKGQLPEETTVIKLWFDQFNNQLNPSNYYKILNNIIKDINNLPTITIYIPFALPPREAEKLGRWLRENVHPQVMLELRLDPTVIGGCALAWQGRYKDYSLRRLFKKRRGEILEIIRKVIKRKTRKLDNQE